MNFVWEPLKHDCFWHLGPQPAWLAWFAHALPTWNNLTSLHRWCRLGKHEFRLSKEDCGDATEAGLDFDTKKFTLKTLYSQEHHPSHVLSFPDGWSWFSDVIYCYMIRCYMIMIDNVIFHFRLHMFFHILWDHQRFQISADLQGAIRVHQERRSGAVNMGTPW